MNRPVFRRESIGVPYTPVRRSGRELWEACCRGWEPAESLDTRDREDLVADLVVRGWTDLQIAVHTRMTEYTTARIRTRLGLSANRAQLEEQAA